jgi:hypothetical protein
MLQITAAEMWIDESVAARRHSMECGAEIEGIGKPFPMRYSWPDPIPALTSHRVFLEKSLN